MTAILGAAHVLCAIGSGSEQVWAAARAGIARIGNSGVMDRHAEAIRMGLVPDAALGPLPPRLDVLPLPSRARRMLQLAAPSLRAVATGLADPVPVIVGMPYLTPASSPWLVHVPEYLQQLTGIAVDRERSIVLPSGRAAGLVALERALQLLQGGTVRTVVVGGVDTHLDEGVLGELDAEQRLLGTYVMDGFIPGEGAAFYVLSTDGAAGAGAGARIAVHAAASVMDPGHRYGDAPARGEGLALALEQARQRVGQPLAPVATTFAGFNGESFDAKLWGVARVRHGDFFAPDMAIEHPADKFGDAGSAMGAILVALAAESLRGGTRNGPALVWAASDREPRACAIVSVVAS